MSYKNYRVAKNLLVGGITKESLIMALAWELHGTEDYQRLEISFPREVDEFWARYNASTVANTWEIDRFESAS